MNDKELADAVVALGIGGHTDNRTGDGNHYYEMRRREHGVWTFDYMLETSLFVRDWRVVGAVLDQEFPYTIEGVIENQKPDFSRPHSLLLSAIELIAADHDDQES